VDFFVCAPHRDLGAITSFSRDAADLHGTIGDFAHLELEKPAHEIGMTARDNNFGAADTVFDRDHISAKAIPYVVVFDDHPLPLRHDGFKFSKIQNDIGTVETPHSSTDNLARTVLRSEEHTSELQSLAYLVCR